MELAVLLRVLRGKPRLVAIGASIALLLGILVGVAAPTRSGLAWSRVALDTRPSQLVRAVPPGSETLGWRSALLADQLLSDPARARIARDVGVPTDDIRVISSHVSSPAAPTALPTRAARAANAPAPYILTVTHNGELATLSLEASAPNRAAATRLAKAATAALEASSSPVGSSTSQAFVAAGVAPVRSLERVKGAQLKAVSLAVVVFVLWCAGIGLLPAAARAWDATGLGRPRHPAQA